MRSSSKPPEYTLCKTRRKVTVTLLTRNRAPGKQWDGFSQVGGPAIVPSGTSGRAPPRAIKLHRPLQEVAQTSRVSSEKPGLSLSLCEWLNGFFKYLRAHHIVYRVAKKKIKSPQRQEWNWGGIGCAWFNHDVFFISRREKSAVITQNVFRYVMIKGHFYSAYSLAEIVLSNVWIFVAITFRKRLFATLIRWILRNLPIN